MKRRRAYGLVLPVLAVSALTASVLGACHRYVTVEQQRERGLTPIEASSGKPASGSSSADPISSIVKQDEENRKSREKLDVTGAGSALERVTSDPVDEFAPAISRDGKQLLFQVETYDDSGSVAKLKQQTLVGVDPNTRGQRTIYTSSTRFANNPAWMPDGASYVYVTNNTGPYALVRALTSAPNAAIAFIIGSELAPQPSHPSPSPDGTKVAFTTTAQDGGHSICTVGIDGSRFTILGEGRAPAYAPEGSSIAFVRKVSGFDQIFLVDGDKGTSVVELTSEKADSDMPAWSPDGQYIAFASNRGYAELGKKPEDVMHLFVMKRDGTGLVQLTSGQSLSGAPAWSSDGWLYFSSNQSGNYDIWRIKLAGALADLSGPGKKPDPPKPTPSASAPPPPDSAPPKPLDSAPSAAPSASAPPAGCLGDWDCKGDRVCDHGQCVSLPTPAPSGSSKKK
ncbi:MAG: hypothetical protein U0414_26785 [Polyangiaceae bacterium]